MQLNPQLHLITTQNDDPHQYNLPTVNHELAAVIPDIPSEFRQRSYWDVILYLHHADSAEHGYLKHIYPNHALYLPLHYVLFYPTGGRGYYKALRLTGPTSTGMERTRTAMSPRMFYRFHLHPCSDSFQILLCGGLLTQQFIVDAWASAEAMDLDFLCFN